MKEWLPKGPIQLRKNKVIKHTPIWIRTIALSMLLAMTYYFAGYRLVYYLLTKDAKSFATAEIKNKNTRLETLVFNKTDFADLKWTEKNKEFSFEGSLYDIVNITKTTEGFTVKAYADKNETQWVKALNDFVKQLFPADNSKKAKNIESIIAACQSEYMPVNALKILSPDATRLVHHIYPHSVISFCFDSTTWRPPSC